MNLMDRAKAYERAADVIRKYGHYKGGIGNTRDGFCLSGALLFAVHNDIPLHSQIIKDARDYLGTSNIAEWNDEFERTPEEVIDLLNGCAAKLRLQAQELVNDGEDY